MVSNNTQATIEQSPIQVLAELNIAWLQWPYENWYFQVDNLLRPMGRVYECMLSSHDILCKNYESQNNWEMFLKSATRDYERKIS